MGSLSSDITMEEGGGGYPKVRLVPVLHIPGASPGGLHRMGDLGLGEGGC